MRWLLLISLTLIGLELRANDNWNQVPFTKKAWQVLSYSDIKPNVVRFNDHKITISVQSSAGPLVYKLPKKYQIEMLEVELMLDGVLKLKKSKQGEKENDDFFFRIGLVYEGEKTLNLIQRLASPDWVKTLFKLADENTGIRNIIFYNVYSDKRLANLSRTHPYSDLLIEKFVAQAEPKLRLTIPVKENRKVLALWISSDGDDTNSSFQVTINKLRYQ